LATAGLDWEAVGVGDVGTFLTWMRYRSADHAPAESTVAVRLAAVIGFYRFREALSGVPVARSLLRVSGRWRGPSRGVLAHLGDRRELRGENQDLRRRLEAAHGEIVRLQRVGGPHTARGPESFT
jgi:hypothetical protein